jgi:hypothetical protein
MPRISNPNFVRVGMNRDTLLEFTLYYDYEKNDKHTKFEVRVKMTVGQLAKFGGMYKLERRMDDILDAYGIQIDEFDKTTIGFRTVEGQKSEFGTYKIHDVYGGYVYPKDKSWGSLKNVWR